MFTKLFEVTVFAILLTVSGSLVAQQATSDKFSQFSEFAENSTQKMDFDVVDQLMHAGVMNMGPSSRALARSVQPSTGTRFTQTIDRPTENESNRFFYESLKKDQEKILRLRKELEAIPSFTPLNQFTKEAQLAYWLNLYNVTLINEVALVYPMNSLKPILTGEDSILDKKLLSVSNVQLSLNDIHYRILPRLYPDDNLYIYGLHQGIKGSPNIRSKAFTESNVMRNLKENAQEFINSNRGTQFNAGEGVVRVSSFYERNAALFSNLDEALKTHLLAFADVTIRDKIQNASRFKTNISNWRINDLYGSIRRRDVGLYVNSGSGTRMSTGTELSVAQKTELLALMRTRAINFGGGSVTVTDLDPKKEAEARAEAEAKKQESDKDDN